MRAIIFNPEIDRRIRAGGENAPSKVPATRSHPGSGPMGRPSRGGDARTLGAQRPSWDSSRGPQFSRRLVSLANAWENSAASMPGSVAALAFQAAAEDLHGVILDSVFDKSPEAQDA